MKKDYIKYLVGILLIVYMVYLWVKKDVSSIYTTLPKEQVVSLLATNVLVTILKVCLIASVIVFGRWLFQKVRK